MSRHIDQPREKLITMVPVFCIDSMPHAHAAELACWPCQVKSPTQASLPALQTLTPQ